MEREWSGYEADCAGSVTEHDHSLRFGQNEYGRYHDHTGWTP